MLLDGNKAYKVNDNLTFKIGDKIKFIKGPYTVNADFGFGKILTILEFDSMYFHFAPREQKRGAYLCRLKDKEVVKVCKNCEKEYCLTMKEN